MTEQKLAQHIQACTRCHGYSMQCSAVSLKQKKGKAKVVRVYHSKGVTVSISATRSVMP